MDKITVADYLIQELYKLGIKDFYGLPGDYNFEILEAVIKHPQTNWIGCTNELNAGYAADGYARIKGYGALITTYGVGELSAVNAIAGSYAESVPVIKITGIPATKFIKNNTMLHHNFQNPDYKACERIFSNVTSAAASLNAENAKQEIDRILSIFIKEKKPVYISIPVDICSIKIDNQPNINLPRSNPANLKAAAEHALKLINNSKKPAILADTLIKRYGAIEPFNSFIKKSSFPTASLLMGKGITDENYKYYMGTFLGEYGNTEAYNVLKESDCVICAGTIFSDLNTMRFNLPFVPDNFINIQGTYCTIENIRYKDVLMKEFLFELADKVCKNETIHPDWKWYYQQIKEAPSDKDLSTHYIFPRLQQFLKPNDLIFAETGILTYAMAPLKLPEDALLQNQVLWGSIGWATPASFGGAMADKSRRTILITGEGSHQLTALEIGNMMKQNLTPVIFVINNAGYTIERLLSKKPVDEFNNIMKIDYSKIPELFDGKAAIYQARTELELDKILNEISSQKNDRLYYIELFIEMMDIPPLTNNILKGIK